MGDSASGAPQGSRRGSNSDGPDLSAATAGAVTDQADRSVVVRPPGLEPRNLQIKNLLLYR